MPTVRLERLGTWATDRENQIQVSATGLRAPVLLVIDFGPVRPDNAARERPKVAGSWIDGLPIVRRLDKDGKYELTFKPRAFSLSPWFGDTQPQSIGWRFTACLVAGLTVEMLPEPRVKRPGKTLLLKPGDIPDGFRVLTVFRKTVWTDWIAPLQAYHIEQIPPSAPLVWIPDAKLLGKTMMVLDAQLHPVLAEGPPKQSPGHQ